MRLAACTCILAWAAVATSCGGSATQDRVVAGSEVVHEFKAHGIVLQNSHLYDNRDSINAAYFATSSSAKTLLFVAVCRSANVARDLARATASPLEQTAAIKRGKNVVLYLARAADLKTRRRATDALMNL